MFVRKVCDSDVCSSGLPGLQNIKQQIRLWSIISGFTEEDKSGDFSDFMFSLSFSYPTNSVNFLQDEEKHIFVGDFFQH